MDAESPLFLKFNGQAETEIGKRVTGFFERKLGLNVTTNGIRSLVETKAEDAMLNNQISNTARAAISTLNGHSGRTVQDYYLKQSTEQAVHNARLAFVQLGNSTSSSTIIPVATTPSKLPSHPTAIGNIYYIVIYFASYVDYTLYDLCDR